MEHRRFHRVKFNALGDLHRQDTNYRVRLENLSMQGALLSSDECILIPEGDFCTLSIRLDGEDSLLVLTVEVMHSFFSMLGVRFAVFEKDSERHLLELLRKSPGKPEQLEQKWQHVSVQSR